YKVNKHWVFSCATALTIAAAGLTFGNVAHADTTNAQVNTNTVTAQVNNTSDVQPTATDTLAANTANTSNTSNQSVNVKSMMDDLAGQSSTQTSQNPSQSSNNLQGKAEASSTDQQQSSSQSVENTNSNQQVTSTSPAVKSDDDNYITFSTKQLDANGNVNFLTQKTYTSIKGQMVADGTVVTWPLTVSDLPANRARSEEHTTELQSRFE